MSAVSPAPDFWDHGEVAVVSAVDGHLPMFSFVRPNFIDIRAKLRHIELSAPKINGFVDLQE